MDDGEKKNKNERVDMTLRARECTTFIFMFNEAWMTMFSSCELPFPTRTPFAIRVMREGKSLVRRGVYATKAPNISEHMHD